MDSPIRPRGQDLAEVGLQFNDGKTDAIERVTLQSAGFSTRAATSVFADDGTDDIAGRLEDELIMQGLGFTEERPPAHIRSWLGALRGRRDPAALEYLVANPHWLDRGPAFGRQLLVHPRCRNPTARRSLDLDWLVDHAVGRTPSKLSAAGQLHACRALTDYQVDERPRHTASRLRIGIGQRQATSRLALGPFEPGQRAAWRPKAAIHLVHTLDHPDYRRATIAGFASMRPGDAVRHLEPIRRRHPSTAPVVAFVTA